MGLLTEVQTRMRSMGLYPDYGKNGWIKYRNDTTPSAHLAVIGRLSERAQWGLETYRISGSGEAAMVYRAKRPPVTRGVVQVDLHEGSPKYVWVGSVLDLSRAFGPDQASPVIVDTDPLSWLNRSVRFSTDSWEITAKPFQLRGHPIYRGDMVAEDSRRMVIIAAPRTS